MSISEEVSYEESYILGLLYGKGEVIQVEHEEVQLKFDIRFRRPTDTSMRTDNRHTVITGEVASTLASRMFSDLNEIKLLIERTMGIACNLVLDIDGSVIDWNKKVMSIVSEKISNHHSRLCFLLNTDTITSDSLLKFPFHLELEKKPILSLGFIQGLADACSLVPNEASGAYTGTGSPRIQLEPSQERWEIPIGLCRLFQIGLGIPVNNINWGHPEIRGTDTWRGQNHQFRVELKHIPPDIELYRINYKKEEYKNLYERRCSGYSPERKLCPYSRRVREGDTYHLSKSDEEYLNNELLDKRLRGVSVDIPSKRSLMICKLMGCTQCEKYYDVKIDDEE